MYTMGVFGMVRTEVCLGYLLGNYLIEVFGKLAVWPKYHDEHSGQVRYDVDTGTRRFGKFGTTAKNPPGTGSAVYPTEHVKIYRADCDRLRTSAPLRLEIY